MTGGPEGTGDSAQRPEDTTNPEAAEGILEMARKVVSTFTTETAIAAKDLINCASRIDEALDGLNVATLGDVHSHHIRYARAMLASARRFLVEAGEHAVAAGEPMAQFVQRTFPP